MRIDVQAKKIMLKSKAKDKGNPFEIEFLEINYEYLDLISNNYLKKARRKLSKMPIKKELGKNQSFENGDLDFEYEVMIIAIRMEEDKINRDLKQNGVKSKVNKNILI